MEFGTVGVDGARGSVGASSLLGGSAADDRVSYSPGVEDGRDNFRGRKRR